MNLHQLWSEVYMIDDDDWWLMGMGMTVLVIFGFDDFFELFFLQDAMIRTASIFNDLGKKRTGRTSLNLFRIFSNLHWA